ncbi:hypothetical protein PGT21_023332 [Puccinia graminis f. sp. tritici]|uniref:Secreted protein n=1 Tax=Puccinia graminis f. sp. tritici TaxID=56615 RepID=A0A5B0MIA0_PUCGR|nr:hypothetical protein PGT21_023332 [Puccinia graminis f. sp. tritici]KAA1078872.1 hypothetical protein PGTUg99_012942 [Puccinia graminis f. sp. tritici]
MHFAPGSRQRMLAEVLLRSLILMLCPSSQRLAGEADVFPFLPVQGSDRTSFQVFKTFSIHHLYLRLFNTFHVPRTHAATATLPHRGTIYIQHAEPF